MQEDSTPATTIPEDNHSGDDVEEGGAATTAAATVEMVSLMTSSAGSGEEEEGGGESTPPPPSFPVVNDSTTASKDATTTTANPMGHSSGNIQTGGSTAAKRFRALARVAVTTTTLAQRIEAKKAQKMEEQRLPAVVSFVWDWFWSLLIGCLVVSYWRGSWVLLDRWTCQQTSSAGLLNGGSFCLAVDGLDTDGRLRSAWITYVIGLALLVLGLAPLVFRQWRPPPLSSSSGGSGGINLHVTPFRASLRFGIVYTLGAATVNVWHGIWYFLDYLVWPDEPVTSGWVTTTVGAFLCFCLLSGNSLLAPPAIFVLDGPGRLPPPIGVTIVTSYRSIVYSVKLQAEKANQRDPFWVVALDAFTSFIVLPWGVVAFWRGFWLLMDHYLWGYGDDATELHMSILYSAVIGVGCLLAASEDAVQYFPVSDGCMAKLQNHVFGRLRTLVLAVGAVNFWRAVWYVWDEFMGESSAWSAALAHVVGVVGLVTAGCLSCITAPPSTLGVDAIAHPDCADEPLFYNVPVAAEALHVLAIARQPLDTKQLAQEFQDPDVPRPPMLREESIRFNQQSAAFVEGTDRVVSACIRPISLRHWLKREKCQFFRSR